MLAGTLTPTQASEFVRVPTCILKTLDKTQVDLFLQHSVSEPHVLYREANYPLAQDRALELVQTCEETLFVRAKDYAQFSQDLVDSLEAALEDEMLSSGQRFELVQYAVSLEVEQSLRKVNCDSYVSSSQTIGRQIASLLDAGDTLPADLYGIVRHDFHTFVHVTNVAGYATLLAKELSISDSTELEKIAIGGLLHDMGKRHIPSSILTKTDPLTPGEWAIIKQHPQRGYEELCHRSSLEHGQLMMVYQHHEHIDGMGYPVGAIGEELHPWAKMLAVVDVFDALTGQRPYRNPMTRGQATEFLLSRAGTQFDKEIVQCWASAMQKN